MQIQCTNQTQEIPRLVIERPEADETATQPARKRRTPPPQFAGRIKKLGDALSSVPPEDWGQNES
jgi:hypothetical protein